MYWKSSTMFQSHRGISDAAHRGMAFRHHFHCLWDEMWQLADSHIVTFPPEELRAGDEQNAGVLRDSGEWGCQESAVNQTGAWWMNPHTPEWTKSAASRLPQADDLQSHCWPLGTWGCWGGEINQPMIKSEVAMSRAQKIPLFPLASPCILTELSLPPLLQECLSITCHVNVMTFPFCRREDWGRQETSLTSHLCQTNAWLTVFLCWVQFKKCIWDVVDMCKFTYLDFILLSKMAFP